MAVIVEDGRLTLTGYVGESTLVIDDWVLFDGFTHAEVEAALAEIDPGADLEVHINSGGGIATEGSAIRAVLSEREGKTDIVIDGIAASAASIIAMGGDSLSMSLGSLLMIHDPSGFTWGTVQDHEKTIRALNALGTTYARVYAKKSGKTDEECREIMQAETWYTPEQAVDEGFADHALEEDSDAVAAFPYQQYARAPGELVALAQNNGWRSPVPFTASARPPDKTKLAKPKASGKETSPMAKPPKTSPAPAPEANGAGDEKARIKAIMKDDAAKGHEALAEHLAYDTDMTADEAIKVLQAASGDAPEANDAGDDAPDPAKYKASRSAASDLAPPAGGGSENKPQAKLDPTAIFASRRGGGTR